MTQAKKTPSISDRRLTQALADLREDVAAPADFRAKLMQRLQQEGIVASPPVVAAPGFWTRLAEGLTPARLGLTASVALSLVLVFKFLPQGTPTGSRVEQKAPVAQAALAPKAVVAKVAIQAVPSAPMPEVAALSPQADVKAEEFVGEEQSQSAPEVAVGGADVTAPRVMTQSNGASASPGDSMPVTGAGTGVASAAGTSAALAGNDPKPTVVVVQASPTPMTKALEGNSELRGNEIRASESGYALLLYRLQKSGRVHVEVYDRLGRSVAVLRDAEQAPGVYELKWNGSADNGGMAASGIYVLQLQAPGYQAQHKLLLVK